MKKPRYCELKGNTWHATLKVPKELRHIFNRTKFMKSLETSDPVVAEERAMIQVGKWKGWVRDARADGLSNLAHPFFLESTRRSLDNAGPEDFEGIQEGAFVMSDKLAEQGDHEGADAWRRVGMRTYEPLSHYKEDWVNERLSGLSKKNVTQKKSDIDWLFKRFATAESITRENVVSWIRSLISPKDEGGQGFSATAADRILSCARDYWLYLHDRALVETSDTLFDSPQFLRNLKKNDKKPPKVAIEPSEACSLVKRAIEREDVTLAHAIYIGMYTGMRIEEVCQLKASNVDDAWITVIEAKTKAGERRIPIHSALRPVLEKLKKQSIDGYIIPGLGPGTHGKRSDKVGKRFRTQRDKLGLSKQKTFHSLRRTVTTQLQQQGVREDVIAAILGHSYGGFTIKHYSDARLDDQKSKAIELVHYPLEPLA